VSRASHEDEDIQRVVEVDAAKLRASVSTAERLLGWSARWNRE
jgi:hypothetical protein